MLADLEAKRRDVEAACRHGGVQRLMVFGSALTDEFDPGRSDIDFLVEFDASATADLFDAYFSLKEELTRIFDRPVDLVMDGAVKNRYVLASIEASKQDIYAA